MIIADVFLTEKRYRPEFHKSPKGAAVLRFIDVETGLYVPVALYMTTELVEAVQDAATAYLQFEVHGLGKEEGERV